MKFYPLAITALVFAVSAFSQVEPSRCLLDIHQKVKIKNWLTGKTNEKDKVVETIEVDGFPKEPWGMRRHCLSAIGRRPVEKLALDGDVLYVRNFTHDNRLFFARIDLSKLRGSIIHTMHFAPVIGDHAEMRIQFATDDAVKLYDTLEKAEVAQTLPGGGNADYALNELLISIEGVPLLGEAYTFTGALERHLTMAYRMMSVADKLDYVKNEPDMKDGVYHTKQFRLAYSPDFLRTLVLLYVAKSEMLGFSKRYELVFDNCGNELMHLLQDVSKVSKALLTDSQQISQWEIDQSTAPREIPKILKSKGLVEDLVIPEFQTEDGRTVLGYSQEFYTQSNMKYEMRRMRALTNPYPYTE